MKTTFIGFILILMSTLGYGQSSSKIANYLSNPIMADSLSTVMIPVQYDVSAFTSGKFLYSGYYANIIFYDFKRDSSKHLFSENTFIKETDKEFDYNYRLRRNNFDNSSKWIFYFVKSVDYNKNKKIDSNDPFILYVSDKHGDGLNALTPTNENAVSIDIYDKQGFALIKMQRDADKDNDFEYGDADYYYIRLDLTTLALGNKIEVKK